MNSNDIKWNKIKAIEKELSIIYDYYNYFYSGCSFELSDKIAKREVWILANKLYDIATEGSKPVDNSYGNIALTKEKVINHVNDLPLHSQADDLSYCINSRDFFWGMYEYTNS